MEIEPYSSPSGFKDTNPAPENRVRAVQVVGQQFTRGKFAITNPANKKSIRSCNVNKRMRRVIVVTIIILTRKCGRLHGFSYAFETRFLCRSTSGSWSKYK